MQEITPVKNHHPTLKPIALNHKILSLFKTPNPQTILLPFAGVYSEVIAAYQVGFDTIIGCELSEEYMTIGEARLVHYMTKLKDARLF
jgi:DNA modification methylase